MKTKKEQDIKREKGMREQAKERLFLCVGIPHF
jgi:hypothetical protein